MTAPVAIDIDKAISVLKEGGVIALPTDTLYALAAAALADDAVKRVYAIKGREDGKPMPLFAADIEMAERYAEFPPMARRLAERFWPGGLTLVVKKRPEFNSEALAGGDTVAFRAPDSPIALAVVKGLDAPITGTSANRSGGPNPISADDVRAQIDGEFDFILDAGSCDVGISSTIVDCTQVEPRILRLGAISEAAIVAALSNEGQA